MKISIEGLQKLNSLVANYVASIELCGSACLDFIQNPKDFDIILIASSELNFKKLIKVVDIKTTLHFKFKYNLCIHCLHGNELDLPKLYKEYGYQFYFRKPLLNYKLFNYPETFDFLKNIKLCKKAVRQNWQIWQAQKVNLSDKKFLYRVYIMKCIDENNSYILTEEQIANSNLLHQNSINLDCSEVKDLVAQCTNWLQVEEN